ncbi:MAG TPA: ABC transporter ATP-binding protein [Acetobacteraceae bacterium]|nr:ABC transporter ATP-binding protein [Acetobacteraceae bacterium]
MDVGITTPLAAVEDLTVRFVTRDTTVHAVNGVSFAVQPGEVLCILGESGSGKSVTLRALMRLLPRHAQLGGAVRVGGQDVLAMRGRALRALRGGLVSMVFQEPMTALDPVYTIGQQIGETVRQHTGCDRGTARAKALELLELVRVPSAAQRLDAYPHELSGGLRQRAMIAMALSCGPRLLLADEPTTALDATVQIQVLILLRRLQRDLGMGMIFVTHDLGVAAEIADRIAVMYAGRVVESGPVADVLRAPAHPYTAGLLASTVHERSRGEPVTAIPGSPPDMRRLPAGCAFAPRCAHCQSACMIGDPPPRHPAPDRMARCLRVADDALKSSLPWSMSYETERRDHS